MKNSILLILILLMNACQAPFYNNINSMGNQPATLKLKNGTTLNGRIQIQSFDDYSSVRNIAFAEGVSKEYRTYDMNEIDNLFFNGSIYYVKMLMDNEMWGGNALRFVKEISTNASDFRLFENEITIKSTDAIETKEYQLFIQLPQNTTEIYNAQGDKFIPNFDDKVSLYLQKCPALSQKIKDKNKDFFYAFVNQGPQKRKQVWMNILNEYNNCKK